MTQPVSHGYPDWGRSQPRADKFINSQSLVSIDAVTTYGRFFVGDIEFLGLRFFASTNHFSFAVTFYETEVSTLPLGNQTFSIRQNSSLDLTIPVTGPWVEYEVTPSAAASIFTQRSWTAHAGSYGALLSYSAPILVSTGASIGANSSSTLSTTKIWPGEAHWFLDSAATNFRAELSVIDYVGNVTIIDMMRFTAAGADEHQVFLPPMNAQLTIFNSTAGSATFRAALVGRPIEPGR